MNYSPVNTNNNPARLYIPFEAISCCCHPKYPVGDNFIIVPEQLSAKGLSQKEWEDHINKLGELKEWENNFNNSLAPMGAFAKIQSLGVQQGKNRMVQRWIAISLTPQDRIGLEAESRLSGVVLNLSCCYGVNEEDGELICHPNNHI